MSSVRFAARRNCSYADGVDVMADTPMKDVKARKPNPRSGCAN
jgi:hypothetical protein